MGLSFAYLVTFFDTRYDLWKKILIGNYKRYGIVYNGLNAISDRKNTCEKHS